MAYATQRFISRSDRPAIWCLDGTKIRPIRGARGPDYMALSVHLRDDQISSPDTVEDWKIDQLRLLAAQSTEHPQNAPWDERNRGVEFLDGDAQALSRSKQCRLGKLRRPRYSRLRRVEQEFRSVLAGHGADLGTWLDDRSNRSQWRLRTCQLSLATANRAAKEPEAILRMAQVR